MQWTFSSCHSVFLCVCVMSLGIGRCDPHSWSRSQWPVCHTLRNSKHRLNLNCHCHFNQSWILSSFGLVWCDQQSMKNGLYLGLGVVSWSFLEREYPWWTTCVCADKSFFRVSAVWRVLLLWLLQGGLKERRGSLPGDSLRDLRRWSLIMSQHF